MKIKNSRFVGSAAGRKQYIYDALPEIAVVGRSNVGKSSLINMLLGRRNLVKTSATPGKTQLINFFSVDDLFRIVDLPGYGFANVSKQMRNNWGSLIGEYLGTRPNLAEVMMLVDIRHKPTQDDIKMIEWIKASGYRGILVATKGDKLGRQKQLSSCAQILDVLGARGEQLIVTSADTRQGKYEVWDRLNGLFEEKGLGIYIERQEKNEQGQI